jgi:hypothetical protein
MCLPFNEAPIWSEGTIVDSNGSWIHKPPPSLPIVFAPRSFGVVVYDPQNGITVASVMLAAHRSTIGPRRSGRPTSLAKPSTWPHARPPFPLSCASSSSGLVVSRSRQTASLRANQMDQRLFEDEKARFNFQQFAGQSTLTLVDHLSPCLSMDRRESGPWLPRPAFYRPIFREFVSAS